MGLPAVDAVRLNNISVVLVHPLYPGNIGSVARAMKNMGLRRLKLVKPCSTADLECRKMAGNAFDIVENATRFGSLEEAVGEDHLVVATTSGRGRETGRPLHTARELAPVLVQHATSGRVALVFGSERSGLSADQLARSQFLVSLPSSAGYPVLNLAQSVLILAYELFTVTRVERTEIPDRVGQADREAMFEHVRDTLTEIGFLSTTNPGPVMKTLRKLLDDPLLNPRDVQIVRGIMSHVDWYVREGHRLGARSVRKP